MRVGAVAPPWATAIVAEFVTIYERLGDPPQIGWLTCGNTTNAWLRLILAGVWTPGTSLTWLLLQPLVRPRAAYRIR